MPKAIIDYSNTIIYKITCKDPGITDVYVGHTTNFVQRKHAHTQSCINPKATNHKCKLYAIIRETGGWKNWKMEIVHFFNCADHYEARIIEQEYFILLNATLNSIEPMPKPKDSIKTFPNVIEKLTNAEKCQTYFCNSCLIGTNNKKDFRKHLSTDKHQNTSSLPHFEKNVSDLHPDLACTNCKKIYKSRTGLWYHLKKCNNSCEKSLQPQTVHDDKEPTDKEIIMMLLKENRELTKLVLEVCQKIQPSIIIKNAKNQTQTS